MEKLIYPIYQRVKPYEYEFTTIAGVTYACYFVSAKEIFSDYPDVANVFYAFNLDVEIGNTKQQTIDERIGVTVTTIIKTFLHENQSAVVYLCDMSDGRQAFRKRKFDSWFTRSDVSSIIKLDREIRAADSIILNSLMISKSHPLFSRIVAVFQDFNESLDNK